jgi:hypothetical protein
MEEGIRTIGGKDCWCNSTGEKQGSKAIMVTKVAQRNIDKLKCALHSLTSAAKFHANPQ